MKTLHIFHDDRCDFCRRCRAWTEHQPAYLELRFHPVHAKETHARFPDLRGFRTENNLVVFSDTGLVYLDEDAWITILWALRDWREWSYRLSRPTLRPAAQKFWQWVTQNRQRWSHSRSDEAVLADLRKTPEPQCELSPR
jgi:predicted DCC family thiol-disulfide oxidoreductase YuxK